MTRHSDAPIVSVVMPAYNVADYIDHAVQSVLAQTLTDIEVIIVDDGSSDATRERIADLAQQDGRVRPIFHEQNSGVSAARNTALDAAKGEWVAVVDPDDWIDPKRLETLFHIAEQHQADAVGDNQHFVEGEAERSFGQLMSKESHGVWKMSAAEFLRCDPPEVIGYGVLKLMLRRSFLEAHGLRYRTSQSRGEDCLFYCDCLSLGATIYLTAEPFYYYRVNRLGSATTLTIGLASSYSVEQVHRDVEAIFDGCADPEVIKALETRKSLIEESTHYREIVARLKDGRFFDAFLRAISKPTYLLPAGKRFVGAGVARLQNRAAGRRR